MKADQLYIHTCFLKASISISFSISVLGLEDEDAPPPPLPESFCFLPDIKRAQDERLKRRVKRKGSTHNPEPSSIYSPMNLSSSSSPRKTLGLGLLICAEESAGLAIDAVEMTILASSPSSR